WMVTAFWNTLIPNLFGKLYPPMVEFAVPALKDNPPQFSRVIPLLFGILLLLRLVPRVAHFSRMAMALAIGFAAGTNLIRYLESDFASQIGQTIRPLVVTEPAFSLGGTISALVVVLGTMCGLVYFFFSREHTGIFGKASRVGIYVLMVSFGAAFGYTVMARISLLTGRMAFLGEWITKGWKLPG
ncbi:MAG TPA: hypothetical protein VFP10_13020, partial [Candidatus Eisenbacteria bacterium]|nr:hypothetical protein [Candidatus Eisenbacteria bacterium]